MPHLASRPLACPPPYGWDSFCEALWPPSGLVFHANDGGVRCGKRHAEYSARGSRLGNLIHPRRNCLGTVPSCRGHGVREFVRNEALPASTCRWTAMVTAMREKTPRTLFVRICSPIDGRGLQHRYFNQGELGSPSMMRACLRCVGAFDPHFGNEAHRFDKLEHSVDFARSAPDDAFIVEPPPISFAQPRCCAAAVS